MNPLVKSDFYQDGPVSNYLSSLEEKVHLDIDKARNLLVDLK